MLKIRQRFKDIKPMLYLIIYLRAYSIVKLIRSVLRAGYRKGLMAILFLKNAYRFLFIRYRLSRQLPKEILELGKHIFK